MINNTGVESIKEISAVNGIITFSYGKVGTKS